MRSIRIGWPALLLVAMPLIALVPKYWLIAHTLGAGDSGIFAAGFGGFGDYAHNLLTDGTYRSCTASPFARCGPPSCDYATRMPVLPLVYAGLTLLVGVKSAAVAYAKCAFTALLAAAFLLALVRDGVRPSVLGLVLLYGLYFGPQALKHAASIDYEEGLLIDLEICLAVGVAYALRPALARTDSKRTLMMIAAIVVATLMYFVKTTGLLTVIVVLLLLLTTQLNRAAKVLAVACVALPFALWIAHNYAAAGEIRLSSSWNGENLYRGSSSEGLALYPQISLDRLFDSSEATLDDGTRVPLGNLAHQYCFANEWAWNDFYAAQARAWATQHPIEAARFQMRKLWVALFELRHTPYRTQAVGAATEYPPVMTAAMFVWMAFARAVFFALIVLLIVRIRAGAWRESLWVLCLLAASWAPYLLVFNYQRHLVPLLIQSGMLLVVLYWMKPQMPAAVPAA
jgi:hypothetical protein